METFDLQKALKDSVQTEKDAMDFYRFGAEKMAEEKARQTFELLAREEHQHARMFFKAYQGGELPPFEEFMQRPPNTESSWWKALQQAMLATFDERKALELAIEQEDALEQELRAMAARIDDPEVKAIYLANASSTHHHKELVEEEYRAMLGMSA
jgi:rubrerythrin